MTNSYHGRLYDLLPTFYRRRDATQGEALRAFVSLIEDEFGILEADIDRLYNNLFIETCDEWVVPYIGDLLGIKSIEAQEIENYTWRTVVADSVTLRQRKGTLSVLGHMASNITGWDVKAVEFFKQLVSTQHINHIRPEEGQTVNVRNTAALESVNTTEDSLAHTVDTRRASNELDDTSRTASLDGRHNMPNVGLFLWRATSYPITYRTVREVMPGCYAFNPLGANTRLFNQPQTLNDVNQSPQEIHLPAPLRASQLAQELDDLRLRTSQLSQELDDLPQDRPTQDELKYFGTSCILYVFLNGNVEPVPSEKLYIRELSEWNRTPIAEAGDDVVFVDPILGRLTFPEGASHSKVQVSYSYGGCADIGGGPYRRHHLLSEHDEQTWRGFISQRFTDDDLAYDQTSENVYKFRTLHEAVEAWQQTEQAGVIRIIDNDMYATGDDQGVSLSINLGRQTDLAIEAAEGFCPSVIGDIAILGGESSSSLTLNGLLIDGQVEIDGKLDLNISHCTVNPPIYGNDAKQSPVSITARDSVSPETTVCIFNSIVGAIRLPSQVRFLQISESIVDGGSSHAIAGLSNDDANIDFGPPVILERVTVLGKVAAQILQSAHETIFSDVVKVRRRQAGQVLFSFVPQGSVTPRRFRCQPDLELSEVHDERQRAQILSRLKPTFISTRYGDYQYAQLGLNCPAEISSGSEDGSEMGVFHSLYESKRRMLLQASLDEYLRHGLNAVVSYVT